MVIFTTLNLVLNRSRQPNNQDLPLTQEDVNNSSNRNLSNRINENNAINILNNEIRNK